MGSALVSSKTWAGIISSEIINSGAHWRIGNGAPDGNRQSPDIRLHVQFQTGHGFLGVGSPTARQSPATERRQTDHSTRRRTFPSSKITGTFSSRTNLVRPGTQFALSETMHPTTLPVSSITDTPSPEVRAAPTGSKVLVAEDDHLQLHWKGLLS